MLKTNLPETVHLEVYTLYAKLKYFYYETIGGVQLYYGKQANFISFNLVYLNLKPLVLFNVVWSSVSRQFFLVFYVRFNMFNTIFIDWVFKNSEWI